MWGSLLPTQREGTSRPKCARWIGHIPFRNGARRLGLFCFPFAGGGASVFRGWHSKLSTEIQVLPVQLPGRQERLREAPFVRLEPLVDELFSDLGTLLNSPFALFGHSMGALVAFEFARRVRAEAGREPEALFVSAARAPHIPERWAPIYNEPDSIFIDRFRRLNGLPEAVLGNPELMDLTLPALRADVTICEMYRYCAAEPLQCPIFAYGGDRDAYVFRQDLEAWRTHTCGPFQSHTLQGDHFFLIGGERELLSHLNRELPGIVQRSALGMKSIRE